MDASGIIKLDNLSFVEVSTGLKLFRVTRNILVCRQENHLVGLSDCKE
jgi:hypothetical protein